MPSVRTQSSKIAKPKGKKPIRVSETISLEDMPDYGIKLCVYGKSGTGKTRFMSTFAKKGKLLHLICSSNGINEARSIRGTKNVFLREIQQPDDLRDAIEEAKEEGYVTVALDHVTGFCDTVLAKLLNIDRIPEQSSWGMATQQQYQQMGLQAKTYLRELMDLDCNVILIGQERTYDKTEDGGDVIAPYVSVATTPSVANWIYPAVDYICHTFKRRETIKTKVKLAGKEVVRDKETGRVEFCLRVGPDPTYITKFRVPPGVELPDVVVDPSYEKIKELIEGDD